MKTADKLTGNGQKPGEQLMQSSLQLLPLIMNNIPQAVFWKDRDLVYLGCNQAFADDAGFSSSEDIIGKTDFDMPWKDQAELYRADDWRVLANGEPKLNYEEPQTTPNGSTIWLSTTKIPVQENGQIVAVLGMYEDITARKQIESAVHESEERFRLFTEATNEGLVFHEQGRIVDANPAALAMFGLSDSTEFIGKNLLQFLLPESHETVLKQMQLETVLPYEVQCIRNDGAIFPVETSTRTYKAGDRVVRATSIRDISERKQAEAAVQESQARFQGLVETLSDWIWEVDQLGAYTYVSPKVKDILGYEPEEVLGKTPFDLMPPEEAQRVAGVFGPLLSTQQPLVTLENINLHKDGHPVMLETSGLPFYDAQGQFKGYRGTDRDITERRQAEQALRDSEARYSAVVTQAKDGVVIIQDNILQFVNEAMADMLGYTPVEMENTPIINYIAPDSRALIVNRIKARMSGQEVPSVYGASLMRKDGTIIDAELSAGVIEYRGRPADVGMIRDITGRKKADEAIRESEDRFRRFTEATVEGLVFHEQGKIVDTNPAAVAMFGFSNVAELIGRNLLEFIVPEYHTTVLKQMQLESVLPYEIQGIRSDHTTFPVETSTRAYKIGDRTIRASSLRDITERKQAEQAQQESQRLLQLVMDNIPQAVFWKDKELTYLGTNQAFAEDAGFSSPQDLVGKTDFDMPWKEQAELYRADDQRVLDSGEGKLNYEEPQTSPTGPITWLRTSKIPMRGADGKIFAVLGMYEDITEWKRLQQQVQEAFERRGHQVQVSTEISQEIAAASELTELFDRIVTLTRERLGYYHTQLFRYDSAQDAVLLISGYGETGLKMLAQGHRLRMSAGLVGTAAATGETVLRSTLAEDSDWQPNPLLPETRGEIAVPIKLHDQVLGVLDVQSDRAGAITDDDRLLLEGLCGQIAIAIEQTRLRQEMTARLEEINRLNRAMSREGWRTYRETTDIPAGFMFDQGRLEPVKDTGLAAELFANVALTVPGGNVIGSLAVADDPQHPFSPEDQTFLQQISDQVASALESARLFEQTQSALSDSKEAQELIRKVIDSTDDWIFVKDRDHRYQLVNQGYAKALHISVEDFIGKNDLDLGFPEELVKGNPEKGVRGFWADDRLVMDTGMPQHYPNDPATIDGQVRVFDTIKIPLRDANNTVWGVLAFARDLTERKQAEEIVAQRATQLEAVATVSTTASTVLDPDKLLQSVVDLTRERFGLYHVHIYLADAAWQTLLLAAGAGEVGRKMVAEEHAIAVDAERSLVARAARERQAAIVNDVRSDPDFLPNPLLPETRSEMAVPMIVGDKVLGVFDVQSDKPGGFSQEDASIYSTLAAQVGVALQNARLYVEQASTVTQLRELDRLKSSFLANMSHELRTPLNSILGFSDVILDGLDGPLTETMENDLKLISRNGQHLLSLINDVLDMAKITAGKMNLNIERFNLHEVLTDVVNITAPLARDKSLALQIETEASPDLEIQADHIRLRQVMINLVGNAIKFTETGGITIFTTRQDGHIRINVRDTGISVPPEQAQMIFEEFGQVDTSTTRKTGGTGLGLPISRKLIELHGGRLWVESTGVRGEGSTFIIELPTGSQHD
jgi:PAS domain S-box-containing protein